MFCIDSSKDKYVFSLPKNILERVDIFEEIVTTN